jgi:hypothetical protein
MMPGALTPLPPDVISSGASDSRRSPSPFCSARAGVTVAMR